MDFLIKPSVKDSQDESTAANTDIRPGVEEVTYVVANIKTTDDWCIPLIKFLESDELPDDDTEAE